MACQPGSSETAVTSIMRPTTGSWSASMERSTVELSAVGRSGTGAGRASSGARPSAGFSTRVNRSPVHRGSRGIMPGGYGAGRSPRGRYVVSWSSILASLGAARRLLGVV